jgi:hypothetical protein
MTKRLFTLCILIGLFAPMYASVSYTDITDVVVAGMTSCDIDFDGDGTAEFTLEDMGFDDPEVATMTDPAQCDFVTWSDADDWDAFKPVPLNTNIQSSSGFYTKGDCYFNPFWADPSHQFPSGSDQYIGVKFKIGANTHFGWVRVLLASDGSVTVKDYAYETTANTAIKAGDKGGATSLNNAEEEISIDVFPNPATNYITIQGIENPDSYISILNQNGQEVKRVSSHVNGSCLVSVEDLAKGCYYIRIVSIDSSQIVSFLKL